MTEPKRNPAEDVSPDSGPDVTESDVSPDERSPRGARRAAVVALRVVRGTVGVWAAVAVILIVGLVPLPTVAIEPPSVEVVPAPADEVRVCAGALLRLGDATGQDAGTGVALGAPSVRSGSVGGTVQSGVLEATDAGTGGTSAAPAVLQLTPEPGATLSAAQSQVVDEEGFTGYAAAACAEPSGSVWLVGGATTIGRTTLLTLANPTEVDATVSLTIYGENGSVTAPGMSGINVAAGSQRVLSLAGFAPELLSPVVHVESRGGRVAAWLQQSITRILDPGGIDLVGESAAPDVHQVIPGVRILDAVGVSRTLGREDYADLIAAVRLAVPGDVDATVTVSVLPEDPALSGASFEIQVSAGTVVDVALDAGVQAEGGGVALADGLYTVTVDADQPVVAGVRVSTAQEPAAPVGQLSPFAPPIPPTTDFAWLSAAPALRGDTLFTVAPGADPRVTVVNSSASELEVLLEAQGGADVSIVVPAHGSASAGVEPGLSYLLPGNENLRAAVSFAAIGRLGGYPIVSGRPGSGPIVILP
jgi:hypothetical protein